MKLLRNYILEVDPDAKIRVLSSWPESDGLPLNTRLELDFLLSDILHESPEVIAKTYILIDNAQDTYWDIELWETFFKDQQQYSDGYRIVLFCSYGSPSARIVSYEYGSPPVVWPRISLLPSWIFPEPVGLLLNREEFDDVVSRSQRVKVDPGLQDFFFDSTAGHVGAVISMLEILSRNVSSFVKGFSLLQVCSTLVQFVKEQRSGITLTTEHFKALNKSDFWHDISKRSLFRRGLPVQADISSKLRRAVLVLRM